MRFFLDIVGIAVSAILAVVIAENFFQMVIIWLTLVVLYWAASSRN